MLGNLLDKTDQKNNVSDKNPCIHEQDIFSIWASDFPGQQQSADARAQEKFGREESAESKSDQLNYKMWKLRLRTKLANVLQACSPRLDPGTLYPEPWTLDPEP